MFSSVTTVWNGTLLRPLTVAVLTVFHDPVLEYIDIENFCNVARVALLGALTLAVRTSRSPSVTSLVGEERTGLAGARFKTNPGDVIALAGPTVTGTAKASPTSTLANNLIRARFTVSPNCLETTFFEGLSICDAASPNGRFEEDDYSTVRKCSEASHRVCTLSELGTRSAVARPFEPVTLRNTCLAVDR